MNRILIMAKKISITIMDKKLNYLHIIGLIKSMILNTCIILPINLNTFCLNKQKEQLQHTDIDFMRQRYLVGPDL